MTVETIAYLLKAVIRCGYDQKDLQVSQAFASDLMSDVLTLKDASPLLITGLANIQTIRTAEMAEIRVIVLARNKKATPEMIQIALENQIVILECSYSMFRISGILFGAGIRPVY